MRSIIRPATAADLSDIVDLLKTSKLPLDGIEALRTTTLVARADARLLGCAALELYGPAALLRSVAVAAKLRGQGLGQQLTQAALDLARERGVQTVYLLTETAGGFFPRFGFRTITRDEIDPSVKQSVQFTAACPSSALAMALTLRPAAPQRGAEDRG